MSSRSRSLGLCRPHPEPHAQQRGEGPADRQEGPDRLGPLGPRPGPGGGGRRAEVHLQDKPGQRGESSLFKFPDINYTTYFFLYNSY